MGLYVLNCIILWDTIVKLTELSEERIQVSFQTPEAGSCGEGMSANQYISVRRLSLPELIFLTNMRVDE